MSWQVAVGPWCGWAWRIAVSVTVSTLFAVDHVKLVLCSLQSTLWPPISFSFLGFTFRHWCLIPFYYLYPVFDVRFHFCSPSRVKVCLVVVIPFHRCCPFDSIWATVHDNSCPMSQFISFEHDPEGAFARVCFAGFFSTCMSNFHDILTVTLDISCQLQGS